MASATTYIEGLRVGPEDTAEGPRQQSGTWVVNGDIWSEEMYFVPEGYSWEDCWCLATILVVEIRTSLREVLATTWLTVQEFGVGESFEEAVDDLLTSLSDYLQFLQAREERLGPGEQKDLDILRHLICALPSN